MFIKETKNGFSYLIVTTMLCLHFVIRNWHKKCSTTRMGWGEEGRWEEGETGEVKSGYKAQQCLKKACLRNHLDAQL